MIEFIFLGLLGASEPTVSWNQAGSTVGTATGLSGKWKGAGTKGVKEQPLTTTFKKPITAGGKQSWGGAHSTTPPPPVDKGGQKRKSSGRGYRM